MNSQKTSLLTVLTAVTVAVQFAVSSRAASFSANPAMDAFVTTGPSGNLVSSNYGGAGSLAIATQSASGNAQGTFASVLQFNTAGAFSAFNSQYGVGQWSIQSVTLQLNSAPANNAIFNPVSAGQFGISFMQNNSWTEGNGTPAAESTTGGITYKSVPSFLSSGDEKLGVFSFNGATSGLSVYTLNLAPFFAADLLSGGLVSFDMYAVDNSINYLFNSRNFGTAADRPLLTINAVPEPASALLCLGGLAMFVAARLGRGVKKRS
jgi:hypothetical protein